MSSFYWQFSATIVLCFGTMFLCLLTSVAFRDPHRKTDISSSTWDISFIQTAKYSSFNQRSITQSFYGAPLAIIGMFSSRKRLCFGMRQQVVCEMYNCLKRSEDPCWENDISSSVWHKFFILTLSLGNELFIKVSCFFLVWTFRRSLLKKWYLKFYLTHLVHSNVKILFL